MTAIKFRFGKPPEPEINVENNSLDEEIFNGIRRLKTLRDWSGIKVREVKPTLFAQEIISVQPMTMPTGLLFWLDYVYSGSNTKEGTE